MVTVLLGYLDLAIYTSSLLSGDLVVLDVGFHFVFFAQRFSVFEEQDQHRVTLSSAPLHLRLPLYACLLCYW